MAIVLIETSSTAAASQVVTDVQAGTLFDVSMGTTSKAAALKTWALVETTLTRSKDLTASIPEGFAAVVWDSEPPSFDDADAGCKSWYLRALL